MFINKLKLVNIKRVACLPMVAISLFIVASCSHNNYMQNNTSSIISKNLLFKETATGSTTKEARANAISLINQDILVSSDSTFTSKSTLNNDKYNISATNDISLSSNGYFKGIVFTKPKTLNNGQVEVTAALSKKALTETINYLNLSLKNNTVNSLAYTELREEHKKVNFLIAILLYAKNNNINHNVQLNDVMKYKHILDTKLSSSAQLDFNVIAPSGNDGDAINPVVKINNKVYSVNQDIILKPGTYNYTISTKNYNSYNGHVELEADDQLSLSVYLQKKLKKPVEANLLIIGASYNTTFLRDVLSNTLKKYQVKVEDRRTRNFIKVEFSHPSHTEVSGVTYTTIPVTITLLRDRRPILSKSYNLVSTDGRRSINLRKKVYLDKIKGYIEEITAGDNLLLF